MIMQLQELKVAALAATPGPWGIDRAGDMIVSNQSHPVATVSDAFHRQLANGDVGKDAEFIAAANPDAILALLGELEASQCALKSVTELWNGQRQRIAELEAKLAKSVDLPVILMGYQSEEYRAGFASGVEQPGEAIRGAGFLAGGQS